MLKSQTKKIHFFTDSSHGWLKVKINDLFKLNIHNQISKYSYMKGKYAYLEEDADSTTYINMLKTLGIKILIINHETNHPSYIRNYQSFDLTKIIKNYEAN